MPDSLSIFFVWRVAMDRETLWPFQRNVKTRGLGQPVAFPVRSTPLARVFFPLCPASHNSAKLFMRTTDHWRILNGQLESWSHCMPLATNWKTGERYGWNTLLPKEKLLTLNSTKSWTSTAYCKKTQNIQSLAILSGLLKSTKIRRLAQGWTSERVSSRHHVRIPVEVAIADLFHFDA